MSSSDQDNVRSASRQQTEYLQAMGIQTWVRRNIPVSSSVPNADTIPDDKALLNNVELPGVKKQVEESQTQHLDVLVDNIGLLNWPQLQTAVKTCTACVLHESRVNTVFGVGDHQAQVMVIGEAPGADEDRQGEPFVGRAGKLLNNMLLAIGFKREQVYIANILKCRPPDNRDPRPEEIEQCEHFLKRQVELIQPKVILALGRIAAHNLMKVETPIGNMRGKLHHYGETPVVVTYHPAYLLRKPGEKARSWDDLRFALKVINGTLN